MGFWSSVAPLEPALKPPRSLPFPPLSHASRLQGTSVLGCGMLDGHCDLDFSERLPNGSGTLHTGTLIFSAGGFCERGCRLKQLPRRRSAPGTGAGF